MTTSNDRYAKTTSDQEWMPVLASTLILDNMMQEVRPKGLPVIVVRADGEVHAFSGVCAHLGCPLINGSLSGDVLTCSCHDWSFSISTGKFLAAPELSIQKYETKLQDDTLFIKV